MILVTLGTQDKTFPRLLEAIEREIKNKNIKEKVIVQAGSTKWESTSMEIYGMIPKNKFQELLDTCDLLITHGGVGTILDGMKRGKKIIAIPRLKQYGEHENDHQLQIVNEFSKQGYIITGQLDHLSKLLKEVNQKTWDQYVGNNEQMISIIESEIEKTVQNKNWIPRIFVAFSIPFILLQLCMIVFGKETILSHTIAWIIIYPILSLVSYLYIFRKNPTFKNIILTILFGLILYGTDVCFQIQYQPSLILSTGFLIILYSSYYIWCKAFIFGRLK